jgi:hypothetical protein
MGNSNGRYKYCINDDCPNKNDRHYHKNGKIILLKRDTKYCPICGEYVSLFTRSKYFYKILYKNEHCPECHTTYEQGTEHNCCVGNVYPIENVLVYSKNYSPVSSE